MFQDAARRVPPCDVIGIRHLLAFSPSRCRDLRCGRSGSPLACAMLGHSARTSKVDKELLTRFFQKSRELFPDTMVEANAVFENGDVAVAEWKLRATNIVPFGAARLRDRVSLSGVSVIQTRNGRITRWFDYYDGAKSRRVELAAHFKEWIE